MAQDQQNRHIKKYLTDEAFAGCLSLQSIPLEAFLAVDDLQSQATRLPITSVSESRLLEALGVRSVERQLIEGLQVRRPSLANSKSTSSLTDSQLSARALIRLAANPPSEVRLLQRKTARWLLRPYPSVLCLLEPSARLSQRLSSRAG